VSAERIELMASAAGRIGGVTWHHLFLVATDASGARAYLRAGPESLPRARLAGRRTLHGDALEDYEAPAASPYGAITFSSGPYEPGGVDFDPNAANAPVASGAGAAQLWDALASQAKALAQEKIPYDPAGRGANWAVMEALRRCGVEAALPPKRWAPGVSLGSAPGSAPGAPSAPTRRVGQAAMVA
jgi:hypothetical protein